MGDVAKRLILRTVRDPHLAEQMIPLLGDLYRRFIARLLLPCFFDHCGYHIAVTLSRDHYCQPS